MPEWPDTAGAVLLRDAVGRRLALFADCQRCGRVGVRLDAQALIHRLGNYYPVRDLPRFLKCSRCGSRKVGVRIGR
jgi:hypothetical protein